MVDKLDDEYVFADTDFEEMSPELTTLEKETGAATSPPPNFAVAGENKVFRNVLIVVAVLMFIIVVYKFIHAIIPKKTDTSAVITPISQPVLVTPSQAVVAKSVTSGLSGMAMPKESIDKINNKLIDLESSQQNLNATISNNTNQLDSINNSTTDLANKIIALNNTIASLNTRLDQQSTQIMTLIEKQKEKKVQSTTAKKSKPTQHYYIQAAIPGRAWIISTSGTTLTVSEGSTIPGYGTVKLVDAEQGRLITSSGKIIKFSQADS